MLVGFVLCGYTIQIIGDYRQRIWVSSADVIYRHHVTRSAGESVQGIRVSQKCPKYSGDSPVCELDNGPLIDDESMTGWWFGTFFSMTVHSVGNGNVISS